MQCFIEITHCIDHKFTVICKTYSPSRYRVNFTLVPQSILICIVDLLCCNSKKKCTAISDFYNMEERPLVALTHSNRPCLGSNVYADVIGHSVSSQERYVHQSLLYTQPLYYQHSVNAEMESSIKSYLRVFIFLLTSPLVKIDKI